MRRIAYHVHHLAVTNFYSFLLSCKYWLLILFFYLYLNLFMLFHFFYFPFAESLYLFLAAILLFFLLIFFVICIIVWAYISEEISIMKMSYSIIKFNRVSETRKTSSEERTFPTQAFSVLESKSTLIQRSSKSRPLPRSPIQCWSWRLEY